MGFSQVPPTDQPRHLMCPQLPNRFSGYTQGRGAGDGSMPKIREAGDRSDDERENKMGPVLASRIKFSVFICTILQTSAVHLPGPLFPTLVPE